MQLIRHKTQPGQLVNRFSKIVGNDSLEMKLLWMNQGKVANEKFLS
jgi:hypothetical protein